MRINERLAVEIARRIAQDIRNYWPIDYPDGEDNRGNQIIERWSVLIKDILDLECLYEK